MKSYDETEKLARRVGENVAMGGLVAIARVAIDRGRVQDVVALSEQLASGVRWVSPFTENRDTLARGKALAYRWSEWIGGTTCLHRAIATRVWLAAFRIESRVVLGFRKRETFAGHAWLEVYLDDAATLIFVEDQDGYEVAIRG